jgi:hypothetical protein
VIRSWLAERLPRSLAIALRIRRVSPEGYRWPFRSITVEPIDTGGSFRAAWRQQDPAVDPREPNGSESSSAGSDHGWSNCTVTSGAIALAYQQPRGALAPWGGDLRHRQSDLSGGCDLYDLRTAWSTYGETLTIRSGAGWSALVAAHDEGRAVVVQGSGDVPGNQSFDGGHACVIAPETHSDGRWLFGDPLATGWQWIAPSAIRSWAEAMSSGIYFATGEAPPGAEVDVSGPTFTPGNTIGQATVSVDGLNLIATSDGEFHPVERGLVRNVAAVVEVTSGKYAGETAYLVSVSGGVETGLLLASGATYVPAEPAPGEPVEVLEVRQAQWDADASAIIGPRPSV